MDTFPLSVQVREKFGTRAASALRADGSLPANITGAGVPTESIVVNLSRFEAALRGEARVFELNLGGKKSVCILQEVQWDYLGDQIQHVEFLRDPDGSAALAQQEAAQAEEAERAAAAEKAAAEAEAAAEAALAAAEVAEAEDGADSEDADVSGSSDEEE